MEWIADPSIWAGLATLVVLEIVLGIDNLIFIAILADKLPRHQRDSARITGLLFALVMRLDFVSRDFLALFPHPPADHRFQPLFQRPRPDYVGRWDIFAV